MGNQASPFKKKSSMFIHHWQDPSSLLPNFFFVNRNYINSCLFWDLLWTELCSPQNSYVEALKTQGDCIWR